MHEGLRPGRPVRRPGGKRPFYFDGWANPAVSARAQKPRRPGAGRQTRYGRRRVVFSHKYYILSLAGGFWAQASQKVTVFGLNTERWREREKRRMADNFDAIKNVCHRGIIYDIPPKGFRRSLKTQKA
ncbi:hypothetical protein B0H16DRAFT_1688464 [Mycena metata]|uniref:Uncharacterized protein n=1 Tax=Mycena metata TaxID=1033252 RepID=A0AAD7JBL8_9AGAR|nr:hypothetical protein B0H16DRAFT_1688464 [Mycena metata]